MLGLLASSAAAAASTSTVTAPSKSAAGVICVVQAVRPPPCAAGAAAVPLSTDTSSEVSKPVTGSENVTVTVNGPLTGSAASVASTTVGAVASGGAACTV